MKDRLVVWCIRLALWLDARWTLLYLDDVRRANTPTWGAPIFMSLDGRVLVLDPMERTPEMFLLAGEGAVELPRRFVFQVTSFGQPPGRAELPVSEARRLSRALAEWAGDDVGRDGGTAPRSFSLPPRRT